MGGLVPREPFRLGRDMIARRWLAMAAVVVLLVVGLLWVRSVGGPVSPHERLSASGLSLPERFNETHGHPRAVLVASPT